MTLAPGVGPFDLVVFGGTGDLAMRKLMPALLYSEGDGRLPAESNVIGVGRTDLTREAYVERVAAACQANAEADSPGDEVWDRFAGRIEYACIDEMAAEPYAALRRLLEPRGDRIRVFYLATHSDVFGDICHRLNAAGLVTETSRVVLEKPLGNDLRSACAVNDAVREVFDEGRIYRIDHYLGKETVQNLLVLRFANTLFEPLWRREFIDHVQITVAETVGVEGRGGFYDKAGALRDMMQNHLLQLLCMVAMEPPANLDPDAVRDEKVKVLRALKPLTEAEAAKKTVRGQYTRGIANGAAVPGYLDELDSKDSRTETFVAIKAELENWRWAGVPFYLRTGKRLPERWSEIVVQFRPVPHHIFPSEAGAPIANRLVIRLQPDEGIKFHMMNKVPGPGGLKFREAPLNLSFAETFRTRSPGAYERLLLDTVRGNPTLFMRADEVEAAWIWTDSVLAAWETIDEKPKNYSAGTWGPSAAIALIERDARTWHEDEG
ncbi:glucose-6-phosphate dehydrogenase [Oceanibacterium hippocampi]|uniref:Glucose-6-phosphate 1-dehydrogenase n=1 Tax=Oceanibacterium hippocampi TaxID=745714 RepID=A0A1Y5U1T4_9PROT|nr:glucose-6-phosphate dehydrogenase [Oceanibacterium hippocampi]SLN74835.1 Glucose-6-phosphate 1-dehydrogenase [Oceanibacterium hippocampi]